MGGFCQSTGNPGFKVLGCFCCLFDSWIISNSEN
jgi:hypothetical protein